MEKLFGPNAPCAAAGDVVALAPSERISVANGPR